MAESKEALEVGQVLAGKYQVDSRLAAGGFAIVYLAQRLTDLLPVAIKALRLDVDYADPKAQDRFVREAAIAAHLQHPNLVRIYDFGHTRDNVLYMVMERLQGHPLSDFIHEETFDVSRVLHILKQLLDALTVAHGQGMVHRDLKPSNVFLCDFGAGGSSGPSDWVKILDFGFAKGLSHSAQAIKQTLTMDGVLVGTPGYVAPELLIPGGELTPRVDLYAVGLLAYEMLTGQKAFPGTGMNRAYLQTTTDPPEPPSFISEHPVYPIIRRLMERDPDARYPTAEEALRALSSIDDSRGKLWM